MIWEGIKGIEGWKIILVQSACAMGVWIRFFFNKWKYVGLVILKGKFSVSNWFCCITRCIQNCKELGHDLFLFSKMVWVIDLYMGLCGAINVAWSCVLVHSFGIYWWCVSLGIMNVALVALPVWWYIYACVVIYGCLCGDIFIPVCGVACVVIYVCLCGDIFIPVCGVARVAIYLCLSGNIVKP